MLEIVQISFWVSFAIGALASLAAAVFWRPDVPLESAVFTIIWRPEEVIRKPYAVFVQRLTLLALAGMFVTILLIIAGLFVA